MQQLSAKKRTTTGKRVASLRKQDEIPAVVYGHGVDNRNITLARRVFQKVFAEAGESSLVDLAIDDNTAVKVLVHDVQFDVHSGQPLHVDFFQVKMDEKLEADVPLNFVGESHAIKGLGGVLVRAFDHVRIECLPQDLIHELNVDISSLVDFEAAIRVSDIAVPKGVIMLSHAEDVVAKVQPPRAEEAAIPAVPTAEDVAKVEVEKKGKEEAATEEGK